MARAMHEESPRYRGMTFSEKKAIAMIDNYASWFSTGGAFVAELDGQRIGMIAGAVTEHFFTEDKFATDFVVYVKPEHRGSSAAVRLIKAFEEWATEQGVKEICLGVSTEVDPERTVCLYERLGYRMSSYSLLKTKG